MDPMRYTTDPVTGPVTFDLDAAHTCLSAEVSINPDAVMATAELSGPTEVTHAASIAMTGRTWRLSLPRTGPTGPRARRGEGRRRPG